MILTPPESFPNRPVNMLLRFSCPMCSTVLEISRSQTGSEGPCPVCGATVVAPSVVFAQPTPQRPSMPEFPAAVPMNTGNRNGSTADLPVNHTARLCDLPPRPAFSARAAGHVPEPPPPEMERKRRRRMVVGMNRPTLGEIMKREYWMILLVVLVLGVVAACALYGSEMGRGFESAPAIQR